jgi:hypothetical protein
LAHLVGVQYQSPALFYLEGDRLRRSLRAGESALAVRYADANSTE